MDRALNAEVFIVGAARTALGSYGGSVSGISSPALAGIAIKGALERANVDPSQVDTVNMGIVLSAGVGQAPAKQAARAAGIPTSARCTAIDKVCSSGLKAVSMGMQSIQLGLSEVAVCGGMENMSQTPYYLTKARFGYRMGSGELKDGLQDGLHDAMIDASMGVIAENHNKVLAISRTEQDNFAVESYARAQAAMAKNLFAAEIVPVTVQTKTGPSLFMHDEEVAKLNIARVPHLPPVFLKGGSITVANSSSISDGAAAVVLASERFVKAHNITPLAQITAACDAEQEPELYSTTPVLAMQQALRLNGMTVRDIDVFEINEAFASVVIANMRALQLDPARVNVHGGAVALGHPIGASGARILVTLLNALRVRDGQTGMAAVCNGGGGATALAITRI